MTSSDEDAFVAFCVANYHTTLESLKDELQKIEGDLKSVRMQMAQTDGRWMRVVRQLLSKQIGRERHLHRELVVISEKIRSVPFLRERYRDEWRMMRCVPRVSEVWFCDETLNIRTEALFGRDNVGKWHRVGPFSIFVLLRGDPKKIQWINLDGAIRFWSDEGAGRKLFAPAGVDHTGYVGCLGTAHEPLKAALDAGQHVSLVEQVVRYPECTGANDFMRFWPLVSPKEVPEWYIRQFGA